MKKKISFLMLLPIVVFMACSSSQSGKNKNLVPTEVEDAKYEIEMYFADPPWSKTADSLFLHFRIKDKLSNKKVFWANLENAEFDVRESGGDPPKKDDVIIKEILKESRKKADRISKNVVFLLLVDRSKSIAPKDMNSIKAAIHETVENLPDSTVYISFFGKQVSEKALITKDNFDKFEKEFVTTSEPKSLSQSIIKSFELFAKEHQKKTAAEYLLVFTDGKIDANSAIDAMGATQYADKIKEIDKKYENVVQIHAFRYGNDPFSDRTLTSICTQRSKPELKGGFFPADNVATIVDSLRGFIEDVSSDYELTLINSIGKQGYNGEPLILQFIVTKDGQKAVGKIQYAIGSKERIVTPGGEASESTYFAIIIGAFLLFIAFFIMQVGIPYIQHKITSFEKKYVKPYAPADDAVVYEACTYCQEPLEHGELIVTKCHHKIHWECWKENGYKCVEFGQNCKEGVQFHFDKNSAFDLKKSPYYLKWAISKLINRLFIWIIYHFTSDQNLFSGFISSLLNVFCPEKLKESVNGTMQILPNVNETFHHKISGLLLVGGLLGFIITFLFGYINEFRQKNAQVIFSIFSRALIGALVGFLSFLIGSIIGISLGAYKNVMFVDAISWLLFGGSVAFCLAFKTGIKYTDALIGGLISGILSFIILYTTYYLPSLGVMISFMLCSAGLGVSIIAKHHAAQKYFLKYKGEKREGEIAIHKWMSDSGGNNEVSIGKSTNCIIQMNWDTSSEVRDMQSKLYIDPKRRVPMLKVLESGMIYDGRDANKEAVYQLKNGVKFKIGNTVFQYVEK